MTYLGIRRRRERKIKKKKRIKGYGREGNR